MITFVNKIQFDIARHITGTSECEEMTKIYEAFEEMYEKLSNFSKLASNNKYVQSQLTKLDIEMFQQDIKSLKDSIDASMYLFEF